MVNILHRLIELIWWKLIGGGCSSGSGGSWVVNYANVRLFICVADDIVKKIIAIFASENYSSILAEPIQSIFHFERKQLKETDFLRNCKRNSINNKQLSSF